MSRGTEARRHGGRPTGGLRARSHYAFRRLWYGERGVGAALALALGLPATVAYRALLAWDQRRRVAGCEHAPLPVISVGSLVAGGSGKTPVTAWLARVIGTRGARAGIVVTEAAADEALLHGHWNPGVRVAVARDRASGVRRLARLGADVAILDDGFQHRELARDLDIVLVSDRGAANGALLPMGPYREPVSALSRADWKIVVGPSPGRHTDLPTDRKGMPRSDEPMSRIVFRPGGWADLQGRDAPAPEGEVVAATGIARPDRFFEFLRRVGRQPVEAFAFPDHHPFGPTDARTLEDVRRRAGGRATLVVTEKDAVKLREYVRLLGPVRALRQRLVWLAGRSRLVRRLTNAAGLPPADREPAR